MSVSGCELVLNDSSTGARVLTRIKAELQRCATFHFYVAFANCDGVTCLIQTLDELRQRRVAGKVLLSQYLNFTEPEALATLLRFDNLEVRIAVQGSMHAKGYYFLYPDRERYVIGSSNWTAGALTTNTELNVLIEAAVDSALAKEIDQEFRKQFALARPVTNEFLETYRRIYQTPWTEQTRLGKETLRPNLMQHEALESLDRLRKERAKKALLVSATGTGKTLLSAFDAKKLGVSRLLFVVHRENIAKAALASYRRVFGEQKRMGLYTGTERDIEADFLFSTVQTISREEHLSKFDSNRFEYIVVDESHRAGAASYARFLDHFNASFLLGMTATPERNDGADIFRYFDYKIAYEIRLQRALEEGILCPFHYFGVTDVTINGEMVDDATDFNRLTAKERVDRIVEKAKLYGCDDGVVRGLIFCSKVEEAEQLSMALNGRGLRTVALSGSSSELAREEAIERLEAHVNAPERLDYILTVDIFNEGVDIPQVNQIIMLRPTQSAIVFVQQLGRGLRNLSWRDKFLTVIDFIGNYQNNYLIPVALYGDRSYAKERIRKLIVGGGEGLPGKCTVDFEDVARKRIFESINQVNVRRLCDLRADFLALKVRLGRVPTMMDFVMHDARDPAAYVEYSDSFYAFARKQEPDSVPALSTQAAEVLKALSRDGLNGKTLEEPLLLLSLLDQQEVTVGALNREFQKTTGLHADSTRWEAAYRCVNFQFYQVSGSSGMLSVGEKIGVDWVRQGVQRFERKPDFQKLLAEGGFEDALRDLCSYAAYSFMKDFASERHSGGFVLYRKYSRADVFRVLGAPKNPVAQNVGGYLISKDEAWCPIFVTYHKPADAAGSIQYGDKFLSPSKMKWFTKSRRNLESPDVCFFKNHKPGQRILLFVQKSNDEGLDFYYLGDVTPDKATFSQEFMQETDSKQVSVVTMALNLEKAVDHSLYNYLTESE